MPRFLLSSLFKKQFLLVEGGFCKNLNDEEQLYSSAKR